MFSKSVCFAANTENYLMKHFIVDMYVLRYREYKIFFHFAHPILRGHLSMHLINEHVVTPVECFAFCAIQEFNLGNLKAIKVAYQLNK